MFLPGESSKEESGTHTSMADPQLAADQDVTTEKKDEQASKETAPAQSGGVRFASDDEEIDPLDETRRLSQAEGVKDEDLSPEAHEQIRSLAMSLQKSRLQENRMANFAYETVSMPPSRVCGMDPILLSLTTSG
jgi:hypothetical protein